MLSFVLSGGGSRGALQVGALQALLEEGIRPDMIIGTSIGAINSVWFAADPTLQGVESLKKLYATIMVDDFFPGGNKFAALNLMLQMPHLFANDRFRQLLEDSLPVKTFGELALPCYVVATDMDSGENRVFGDNPDDRIIDGIMSSTAMTPSGMARAGRAAGRRRGRSWAGRPCRRRCRAAARRSAPSYARGNRDAAH